MQGRLPGNFEGDELENIAVPGPGAKSHMLA
jgi:hypothetical protein